MLLCDCLFIGGAFTVYKILSIMSIRFLKNFNIHFMSLNAVVHSITAQLFITPAMEISTTPYSLLQTMVYLVSYCCIR